MIEIPEHLLWDGDTKNIETWEFPTYGMHFWFSPSRFSRNLPHYYGLLEDGRVVKVTNQTTIKSGDFLPEDVLYLGIGASHHKKKY